MFGRLAILCPFLIVIQSVGFLMSAEKRERSPPSPLQSKRRNSPGKATELNSLAEICQAISKATGEDFYTEQSTVGSSGGGGAQVGTLRDRKTGKTYFMKAAGPGQSKMLEAEFLGIKAMAETKTIKVPEPICFGKTGSRSYVIFEYLDIGGGLGRLGDQAGRELAAMHRCTSSNGMFGFDIDNSCGATPQPNKWTATWAEFFDEQRLGHMFKLCRRDGYECRDEAKVRQKVREILSEHEKEHGVKPALVHGDLWTGNIGSAGGRPVIFDPSTYYGDREVDIAMSRLFGSLPSSFYGAYNEEWSLPPGFQQRQTIYNLYHILNHYVLFGGGYQWQAESMISQILKM